MSSESDPLLPKGNSAPEIQGFGFSQAQYQSQHEIEQDKNDGEEFDGGNIDEFTNAAPSPLRIIIAMFTVIVGLAVVITLLVPGVLDNVWKNGPFSGSKSSTPGAIEARVNKILSENPLIGLFHYHYSMVFF